MGKNMKTNAGGGKVFAQGGDNPPGTRQPGSVKVAGDPSSQRVSSGGGNSGGGDNPVGTRSPSPTKIAGDPSKQRM